MMGPTKDSLVSPSKTINMLCPEVEILRGVRVCKHFLSAINSGMLSCM